MGVQICFQGADREKPLGKWHLTWSVVSSSQDHVLRGVCCAVFCLIAHTYWEKFPSSNKPV